MMELDEAADGQTIDLAVGEVLTIRLLENPTTGYRWEARSMPNAICDLVSNEYLAPAAPIPGASGTRCWMLRAARLGDAGLLLVYRRPWDGPSQQEKTFAVRLRVG